MPKKIPKEVRDKALDLFIRDDKTVEDIADEVSKEFKVQVRPPTIYAWARKYDWKAAKIEARNTAVTKVAESEAERLVKIKQEQLDMYGRIRSKADKDLKTATFRSALDAVNAAKIGADGELELLTDMMHMGFIEKVGEILLEEISDEELLMRLVGRLRSLIDEEYS